MEKDPLTPPGLPSDWRDRALSAARAQLAFCTRSTELAPVGCPQIATVDLPPAGVRWKLMNEPLAGATSIARANGTAGQAVITVFGRFQMRAEDSPGDGTPTRITYSGGVAQATMTWDGTGIVGVHFTSESVADQLPAGVHVPSFDRSAGTSDAAVLSTLQSSFTGLIPSGQGTLASDPTSGATVAFDATRGDFTVTGGYATVAGQGASGIVHRYSATLIVEFGGLVILSVVST
jgi:hypothetical protein